MISHSINPAPPQLSDRQQDGVLYLKLNNKQLQGGKNFAWKIRKMVLLSGPVFARWMSQRVSDKNSIICFFNLFFSSQRNPTVLIGAMKRYHKQVFIWKVTFFSEMNSWKSFWSSFSVSHMAWEVSVTRRMDYFVFFGLLNQSKFAQYYKNWH